MSVRTNSKSAEDLWLNQIVSLGGIIGCKHPTMPVNEAFSKKKKKNLNHH